MLYLGGKFLSHIALISSMFDDFQLKKWIMRDITLQSKFKATGHYSDSTGPFTGNCGLCP